MPSPPLGLGAAPETSAGTLGVGDRLLLFTDGLIEDRPVDIDAAMERLRTWPSLDLSPQDLCDDLLAHFGQDKSDDVALFVLRWPAPAA